MTRPLVQVWASLFNPASQDETYLRDLQRAQQAWRGEQRMWLMPGLEQPRRWHSRLGELPVFETAIPSEEFDVIQIYSIDEEGRVFPPLALPDSWDGRIPEGLYRHWLNASPGIARAPSHFTIQAPSFEGDKISFARQDIPLAPVTQMPFAEINEAEREVTGVWPPPGAGLPSPVSPEGEMRRLVERPRPDFPLPLDRTLAIVYEWPEPFRQLFPASGADPVFQHTEMRRLVNRQAGRDSRLQVAAAHAGKLVDDIEAPLWYAWMLPGAAATESGFLMDLEGRYDISAPSIEVLLQSDSFKVLQRPTPVVRTLGWLGYFWWELRTDLQAVRTVRVCERCSKVIRGGHQDRRYCNRDENVACFRDRQAENQRRKRNRR